MKSSLVRSDLSFSTYVALFDLCVGLCVYASVFALVLVVAFLPFCFFFFCLFVFFAIDNVTMQSTSIGSDSFVSFLKSFAKLFELKYACMLARSVS